MEMRITGLNGTKSFRSKFVRTRGHNAQKRAIPF